MRNVIAVVVLLCFAAVPALADVTNEVTVGFQSDSSKDVTDAAGNDISGDFTNENSRMSLLYTHYFSPLKDDGTPIELRRFYQHPSSLSAGLLFFGTTERDSRIPIAVRETKSAVGMLLLGGELFLSTNTGFFLNIGAGSGAEKTTVAGISMPETDLEVSRFELGVRQYISQELLMHLRFSGETTVSQVAGFPEVTSGRGVIYLGARGVIRDTLGLAAEIGGGGRDDDAGGTTVSYDIAALNLEGSVYVGKDLSFRLALETETVKRTTLPEHTTKWARMTLDARYWFSEKVGLLLPFYSETTKGDGKDEMTNNGMGLYANFRF